jgi:hypothetical protein
MLVASGARSQLLSRAGREHGRTIPLADIVPTTTGQQAPVAPDQEAGKDPATLLLSSSALAGS